METQSRKIELLPDTGPGNFTVFCLGATRCGKTNLMAVLLRDCFRFVVFDTKKDYAPEYFGNQTKVVHNLNELVTFLNAQTESRGYDKIIFDLSDYKDDESDDVLNAALLTIYEFQLLNKDGGLPAMTVCLDEMNRFVESKNCPPGVKEIVQRGGGVGIQKIFGAQWFGDVPTWCRDTFSEIYVWRHSDPSGLKRLELFGFDPEEVKNLPKFTCLHFDGSQVLKIRLQAESRQEQ